MDEYVRKADVLWITCQTGALETQSRVNKLPSVNWRSIKQCKWIISNLYARCSVCSTPYDLDTFRRLIPVNETAPRYCTYCGSEWVGLHQRNDPEKSILHNSSEVRSDEE